MQGPQEGFWFTALHTLISPIILSIRVGEKIFPPPLPNRKYKGHSMSIEHKKHDPHGFDETWFLHSVSRHLPIVSFSVMLYGFKVRGSQKVNT